MVYASLCMPVGGVYASLPCICLLLLPYYRMLHVHVSYVSHLGRHIGRYYTPGYTSGCTTVSLTPGYTSGCTTVPHTWVYLRVYYDRYPSHLGIPQGVYQGCTRWVYLRVYNSGVPREGYLCADCSPFYSRFTVGQ